MTQLWLLEDLEPFPDRPEPGDAFAPTTFWADASAGVLDGQPVPADVCSHVRAVVRPGDTVGDHIEWVADLGDGFTTLLRGEHTPGEVILHGCLVWDRYLWIDHRTQPPGRVRVIARDGHIIQHRKLTPARHPGWFSVHYDGPALYAPAGNIPAEHDIRYNVLVVATTVD
ncbi:hypothetical protein ACLQ3C_00745 [Gordonia sp. DT30]|uniref:hypothetical protein n=1 Tax=unclassified Gordonia (in: high G+C Gram-positive bacteria) TaxID=2657482 RepID=UPI003CF03C21